MAVGNSHTTRHIPNAACEAHAARHVESMHTPNPRAHLKPMPSKPTPPVCDRSTERRAQGRHPTVCTAQCFLRGCRPICIGSSLAVLSGAGHAVLPLHSSPVEPSFHRDRPHSGGCCARSLPALRSRTLHIGVVHAECLQHSLSWHGVLRCRNLWRLRRGGGSRAPIRPRSQRRPSGRCSTPDSACRHHRGGGCGDGGNLTGRCGRGRCAGTRRDLRRGTVSSASDPCEKHISQMDLEGQTAQNPPTAHLNPWLNIIIHAPQAPRTPQTAPTWQSDARTVDRGRLFPRSNSSSCQDGCKRSAHRKCALRATPRDTKPDARAMHPHSNGDCNLSPSNEPS
jgi:hypothetical protein